KVIGWHQGRSEFGPRALGHRSIIGDPRNADMQSKMNLKIKFRESFRPFAPAVLAEKADEYFDLSVSSNYMLIVAPVTDSMRLEVTERSKSGLDLLKLPRSKLPAVTHVDFSARIQTVEQKHNKQFYDLIVAFEKLTGCAVLINTSFNVRGEPIVQTPIDSYRCFMRTGMDVLVIENHIFYKDEQSLISDDLTWKEEFTLD
ncbi:hypothetical protein N9D09_00925, partial [bacterium]|nr:hypothetical protein [bacterium]